MSKFIRDIPLFIRSLIFAVFSLISLIIYSTLIVAAVIFPLRIRHLMIRSLLRLYIRTLRVVCHINYEVEGMENIPKHNVAIVMSKHQSAWETFFLPTIFHDPAIILKRELLWIPFFGWGLAVSDPIAIDRKSPSSAMQQILLKGKSRLDAGRWVLVFPEGTRVPFGQVGNYRLGGTRLAVATGYPVLPIAHNAGRYWPRKKFVKIPGTIKVVIGPLITSINKTPEDLLSETKEWIESTVQRIESFVDKSAG
jgi:1-acyl-sn-glycerol-3-phosphate acyltransferase